VRILHACKFEVFFPVGFFFLQWRGAITNFNPASGLVRTEPGILHVPEILALSDRPLTQRLLLDGFEKRRFTTGLYAGSN